MRSNVEKCGYCGRYMRYENDGEYGEHWMCSRQAEHIVADPKSWSVDTIALGPDAVDADGEPVSGFVWADTLTPRDLRIAVGLDPQPADSGRRVRVHAHPLGEPCPPSCAHSSDGPVHWAGETGAGPTSLHGNGAKSFARTSGDEDEVTCKLCLTLLARESGGSE